MSAASELKTLYRDYSLGQITREQYRAARAPILEAAASQPAEPPAEEADKTRPNESRSPEPTTATDKEVAAAPVPAEGPKGSRRWVFAAVPVIAAAALVAWLVLRAPSDPGSAPQTPSPEASVSGDATAPAQADRAKALARKFLFANDWSEESIRTFVTAWRSLTAEERAAAEGAVWMPGVVETVRRYVQEERALLAAAGLAPDVSESLAELAGLFGIDTANLPVATANVARAEPAPADAATAAAAVPVAAVPVAAVPDGAESLPAAAPTPPSTPKPEPQVAASRPATEVKPAVSASAPDAQSSGAPADKCPASLVRKKERFCRDTLAGGRPGPLLVVVPAGRFRMGSEFAPEERPVHDVALARPFAIGVHEVSVDEYRAFCESAGHVCPALPGRAGDAPVVKVSWRDAVAYVEWLSAQSGQAYRLPTEAEWEYAARGGTQTRYPYGDELTSADAAFSGTRPRQAAAARSERFNRNAFNLYHVVGNVREWVQDDWLPTHEGAPSDGSARRGGGGEKVVRGGSFADGFDGVRSSARQPLASQTRDEHTGIRVAREIR